MTVTPARNGRKAAGFDKAPQFHSQKQLDDYVLQICNILRASGAAGAMQYVPELSWLLFLRMLDLKEIEDADAAALTSSQFTPSLAAPYRWQDWAAPGSPFREEVRAGQGLKNWINGELLPHLSSL